MKPISFDATTTALTDADVPCVVAARLSVMDWHLAAWDGTRHEQLRRWAALPLARVILAPEEMENLSRHLSTYGKVAEEY